MSLETLREAAKRREDAVRAGYASTDPTIQNRHGKAAALATDEVLFGLIDHLEENDPDRRAALERAADIAHRSGGAGTRTFHLPTMQEYRAAINEGTDSQGGYLVPAEQSDTFFDLLRSQSVVLRAGPRILPMSGEVLKVPKILTSTTSAWWNEGATISSTEATFEAVTLTARKLAAYCLISNESLADSTPALRDVLAYDFAASMASALDDAFLEGSGSPPVPKGIRNFASIGVTYGLTNAVDTDGGRPTMNLLGDQLARVEAAGGNVETCAWFMNPRTWADIQAMLDDEGRYLLTADPTIRTRRSLWGVPVYTSGNISVTETRGGSGAVCSYAALCDMSQIVIGRRDEIQLRYSEDFSFDTDQTAVRATSRWDIMPINVGACDILAGLTS